jgi:superoxide dismutase, Cu-Zn family
MNFSRYKMSSLTFGLVLGFSSFGLAKGHSFDIKDGSGNLIGIGTISKDKKHPKITFDLKAAEPGIHGVHLHSKGLCQGPKFETAGGHLNPDSKHHGHKNSEGPHAGDLGNLEVPANGQLKKVITLSPHTAKALVNIDGVSVIIHANLDDEKTDPSGNAGNRLYCRVVEVPHSSGNNKSTEQVN